VHGPPAADARVLLGPGGRPARPLRLREGLGGRTGRRPARGRPAPDRPWRVGIRHPENPRRLAAALAAEDLAVATSGAYERGAHIVDPHSGRPPTGLLSVTVVGPDLALADAYATAAFAMGVDGPGWIATVAGYDAMCITGDRRVVLTPGFDRHRVS
jgi:thiamine biosynthesis lipoprotein